MTWNPEAIVTVAGVDFTGQTLNGLSITYGRPTIWDQARAGYANVQILNKDLIDYAFQINDEIVIKIQDSNSIDITVFTGKITSITNEIATGGTIGQVAVQTLNAVSSFAQMSRTIVGTVNYPKEYDDARINRILTEAGVSIDVVDSPGVYELTARTANPVDAYTLASYYAGMCFGYLYETTDGKVGYANESRRTVDVEANGYLDIDEGYINWRGIQSKKSIADILNRVILFYKNNDQVTSEDTASIANYGLIEGRINTELEDADQAQNIADRYVSLRSIPETNFSSFNINLDNPNLLAADLDDLIAIQMGTAIQIDNLPNPISPITYTGFVEGWTLTIDQFQALLTITSSDSTYSVVPIRWQDVDPLTEWDDLDPTAVKTTRTNLVKNPSFEVNTTGWANSNANSSHSQYTADSYFGDNSLLYNILVTGATNHSIRQFPNATYRIAVAPGETLTVIGYGKNLSGTRNLQIRINVYATSTSTTLLEQFSSASLVNPTNWGQISLTATITQATAAYAQVTLGTSNTGLNTDQVLYDGILCVKESSNTYYWDGTDTDIPASRRPELAWTGTPDLSTSTAEAYFGTIPTLTWANVDSVGLP
jgi:hypothetical protein